MEKVVIATATMYEDLSEVRFNLALRTVKKAKEHGYQIVVVDESPDPNVRELFKKSDAIVLAGDLTTMGAAIRKSLSKAAELADKDGIIVRMEPEKHTFVNLIPEIVGFLLKESADVVIPRRKSLASYPKLQQLNEPLGNKAFQIITGRALDIYFGPQIFRSGLVGYYSDYDGKYGDKWDALQIPVVRMIAAEKKITEVVVDYVHPEEQKTEETLEMLERRFEQIINLKEAVKKESIKLGFFSS